MFPTVRLAVPDDFPRNVEVISSAYGARGYCSNLRAEQYLETNSYALVAEKDCKVLGTLRVMYDEGMLPADQVFPKEMAKIREDFLWIAYYGTLGVRPGMWKFSIGVALIQEAIRLGLDDVLLDAAVIVVNPHHVNFYLAHGFEEVARCDDVPGLASEQLESGKIPGVLMLGTRERLTAQYEKRLARQQPKLLTEIEVHKD